MSNASDSGPWSRFSTPMMSVDDRKAAGKLLREKVPHAAHGVFRASASRRDPVAVLEAQAKTRLPELVPIRYARMLVSPFAFLRGSAQVMAGDLADTPVSALRVQANGDMHVANFGLFASAERNLIFGINDFDETLPSAWEWDLKRLVASAAVACRFMGGDAVLCEESVRAAVRSYRKRIRDYSQMGNLDVWYSRIGENEVLSGLSPQARQGALRIIGKARQRGRLQVLQKMTELMDDRQRIIESAPLIVRETHAADGTPIAEAVGRVLDIYVDSLPEDRRPLFSRYRVLDVARKVVGVGSVGTRCWVVLFSGNGPDDSLMLQYKEAQPSVLAPYLKAPRFGCEGKRVVVGQRLIQGAPDIFLGWGQLNGVHFYVRQLRDMKGGVEFDPARERVRNFPEYCRLCGWALALAHAKSGDSAAISGYLGAGEGMDEALSRFAASYADQTERDYEALSHAARAGRIQVASA